MKGIFRVHVRHGASPAVILRREDGMADCVRPGDHVSCFPESRATEVESVIWDLDERVIYVLLRGIHYSDAEAYVNDLKWLREHKWETEES